VLDQKLLSIYLNDHLAGSTAGVELAKRSLSSNRATPYGDFLEWLMEQIAEDRRSLISLMSRLGIRRDPFKQAAGWGIEKAGRLKLNGRLTGYSPLSRLVELEGLWTGVNGKLSLWRALTAVAAEDPRLDPIWLIELQARADEQLRRIDEHRNSAARDALSGAQRSEVRPGPAPGSSSSSSGSATTSVESSSSASA
jgi:hypothetical protein